MKIESVALSTRSTICIQCALKAFVKHDGRRPHPQPWGAFNETPGVHMKRVHPNGLDSIERQKLGRQAVAILNRHNPPITLPSVMIS